MNIEKIITELTSEQIEQLKKEVAFEGLEELFDDATSVKLIEEGK